MTLGFTGKPVVIPINKPTMQRTCGENKKELAVLESLAIEINSERKKLILFLPQFLPRISPMTSNGRSLENDN